MNDEMRIAEITLVNYRQYYGTVKVDFPARNNVFSILQGTNSAGKSNVCNAINWCLFGKEPHLKSETNMPSIVNTKCLLENKSKMITMAVTIIIEKNNIKYRIERKIEGLLHDMNYDDNDIMIMSKEDPVPQGFEIMYKDRSKSFQISENNGKWEEQAKNRNFDTLVNRYVISEKLAPFFILDGEFLIELFQKFKEVKTGISQISQLDIFEEALESVEKVRFRTKIKNSQEASKIEAKIHQYDQHLASENNRGVIQRSTTELVYGTDDYMHMTGELRKKDLETTIKNIKNDMAALNKKINDSDAKSKTDAKVKYGEKKEAHKRQIESLRDHKKEYAKLLITEGPFIMCRSSVETTAKLIYAEMAKGKLPSSSKRMLVNDLLDMKKCLCGSPLEKGTDARKKVEREMNSILSEVQYDAAGDVRSYNEAFLKNYEDILHRIDLERTTISHMTKQLEDLNEEIRNLKLKLPKEDENYAGLIHEYDSLVMKYEDLIKDLGITEQDVLDTKAGMGDELRRLKTVKTRKKEDRQALLLVEKSSAIQATMEKIKGEIDETIRKQVSQETLKIFNNLHWKKTYNRLIIDGKYNIRLPSKDKFDMVGGLSAGEYLFLALSFIMALKKITNYRFPFIIDSSLGKAGGNLRINFGTHMPALLDGSQFIMLVTNSEYTKDKIRPEDGSKATHTLKDLFLQKADIQEYDIRPNKQNNISTIVKTEAYRIAR